MLAVIHPRHSSKSPKYGVESDHGNEAKYTRVHYATRWAEHNPNS